MNRAMGQAAQLSRDGDGGTGGWARSGPTAKMTGFGSSFWLAEWFDGCRRWARLAVAERGKRVTRVRVDA